MNPLAPLWSLARAAGLPRPQTYDVTDRTVLITGAGSGIGAALARELHARGAHVVLLDRDVTAIASGLQRTTVIEADVTDRAAMAAAIGSLDRLDVVVANAGVAPALATLRTLDPDDYDRVIAVNQTGVFNTVRPAIDPIIDSDGHIVVVASMAALLPGPGGAPYMISKAAVEALGRTLRVELADHRASAGVAYFGIVETAMTRSTLDADPRGRDAEQALPAPLRKRISAEAAARVIADGIARRAPHTVAPAAWNAVHALRGLGTLFDAAIAADPRTARLLRQVDGDRERAVR